MDTFVDIYATKGIEYLIAVAYLFSFIFFWKFLTAKEAIKLPEIVKELKRKSDELAEWFMLPENLYYHLGHSWVKVESGNTVTVGMDDFAQKLVGDIEKINLPAISSPTLQGEKGWSLNIDERKFDMISPVSGEILSVNREAKESPEKANIDPYPENRDRI